jgi:hypothetical protein
VGDNQGAGAPGADHMVQRKNTEKKVKPNPSHDALPLEIDCRYRFLHATIVVSPDTLLEFVLNRSPVSCVLSSVTT